jgi:hypothetical protein
MQPFGDLQLTVFTPGGFQTFEASDSYAPPAARPTSSALPKVALEYSTRETAEVRQVRRVLARATSPGFDDVKEEPWTMERLARAAALSVGAVRRAVGVLEARGEKFPDLLQ